MDNRELPERVLPHKHGYEWLMRRAIGRNIGGWCGRREKRVAGPLPHVMRRAKQRNRKRARSLGVYRNPEEARR